MNDIEIKTVRLVVNSDEASKQLTELRKELDRVKKARADALEAHNAEGIAVYTKEATRLERQIRRIEPRAEQMARTLGNLDKSTPKQLQQTLREITNQLNSGKIERGSKEWNTLTRAARETESALKDVKKEVQSVTESSFGDRIAKWGTRWTGFIVNAQIALNTTTRITSALQDATQAYADMEEAKAQVRKYTGLSAEEVDRLNESLKQMDTRTSREQLNALAGDAGRLGITAEQDIQAFVRAADQINVALGDDLGDGAVKNVGKLAMLFGEDKTLGLEKAMLSTASAINELSQNSSAGAEYIEDFTARLAGVGRQAGLSQTDIMGFAAVLDESMLQDETAATALSQIISKMYAEPAKFARMAGKDVKEFTDLLKNDANGALLAFFRNLNAQGGFDRLAPMFAQMGLDGTRASGVLSTIADRLDLVRERQQLANQAYADATSIANEAAIQNNTVQAQRDKAIEQLNNLRIELGEKLMPVATEATNIAAIGLKLLVLLVKFVADNRKHIITLTAAIVAYNVVMKATNVIEALHNGLLKTKALRLLAATRQTTLYRIAVQLAAVAQGLFTVALALFTKGIVAARIQFALLTATMAKNPLGLIAVALSVVIGTILEFTGLLGDSTEEVKKNTRALTAQQKAVKDCAEAQQQAAGRYDEEARKIEALRSIIRDNTRSIDERRAAIEQLQRIVPDYQASISRTGDLTERNTQKIKDYLAQLKQQVIAEAMYDKIKDAIARQAHAEHARGIWESIVNDRQERYDNGPHRPSVGSPEYYRMASNLGRLNSAKGRLEFWDREEKSAKQLIDHYTAYAKQMGAGDFLENLMATGGESTRLAEEKPAATTTTGGKGGKSKTDPVKAERNRLEGIAAARKVYETAMYQAGELTRREYDRNILDIDLELYEQQRDLYKQGSREYEELEQRRLDAIQRGREQQAQWSAADIARQEAEATAAAQRELIAGTLTEEQYQRRLDEIKLAHLRKRADLYRQWGDAERAAEFDALADAEDLRQQMERRREYLRQRQQMESEYDKKTIDEREQDEVDLLDRLITAGVIAEEKRQKYLRQIREKYDKERRDERDRQDTEEGRKIDNPLGSASGLAADILTVGKALENLQAKLRDGEASWEDYAAIATASLAMVSTMTSTVSQLFTARQQQEEAAVTRRYDAEIRKAGQSSKRGRALEEQKQKELQRIQAKYRKKQMDAEMAAAVAQTAIAAINAMAAGYRINVWMGPVAAAAALAAGAIQIATIRKQHEAESKEYYDGGFTGGTDYRREAGIVHQGEFVANRLAVRNPAIAPMLRLIDHAQRNGTIATLTAADVSRAIAAPMATAATSAATAAAPALQVVDTTSERTADALDRLNDTLDAGIRASVSIAGDDGFDRQWQRYQKLRAGR